MRSADQGSRAGLSHFHSPAADARSMDLTDLVPSLKRAVAAPGEFDIYFPDSGDADLAGTLADALAEAQLDGFLGTTILNVDDVTATPDLTTPQQALVILYAMARVLRARVANAKNRTRYKAGNTEAETEQSATVLVELLKETSDRKKALLLEAKTGSLAHAFQMVDMYVARAVYPAGSLGFYARGSDYQLGYGGTRF